MQCAAVGAMCSTWALAWASLMRHAHILLVPVRALLVLSNHLLCGDLLLGWVTIVLPLAACKRVFYSIAHLSSRCQSMIALSSGQTLEPKVAVASTLCWWSQGPENNLK